MGWIFTQSAQDRDYIMSSEEIQQIAAMQDEVGEHCVTGVVSIAEAEEGEGTDIHFEVQPGRPCTCRVTLHDSRSKSIGQGESSA